jgi:hypothetical protein
MPWGWIIFATPTASEGGGASTSSKAGLPTDPEKLEEFVRDVIKNAGAEFYGLYFEVGERRCHVIVKDLDDYEKAKAVTDILDATAYIKLLDSKQAKKALRLEVTFRKRPRGNSARPKRPKKP